jgi:hypothetical protein
MSRPPQQAPSYGYKGNRYDPNYDKQRAFAHKRQGQTAESHSQYQDAGNPSKRYREHEVDNISQKYIGPAGRKTSYSNQQHITVDRNVNRSPIRPQSTPQPSHSNQDIGKDLSRSDPPFPHSPPASLATTSQDHVSNPSALDSLAKLRQFKAEVEASRQSKAIPSIEASKLAQVAESYLLSVAKPDRQQVSASDLPGRTHGVSQDHANHPSGSGRDQSNAGDHSRQDHTLLSQKLNSRQGERTGEPERFRRETPRTLDPSVRNFVPARLQAASNSFRGPSDHLYHDRGDHNGTQPPSRLGERRQEEWV